MPTNSYFDLVGKRVWVAGHRGMVGSAIVRRLGSEDCEILVVDRQKLDLLRQADVEAWLASTRPDAIIMAAAKVGGISANESYPADFLHDNLVIQTNIIEAAYRSGVAKLLFLGSSCIYPKMASQPISEECLLSGYLEPTNEWYAIAKIAGVKLCEAYRRQHDCDFISAMPTNLYGPGDNFNLDSSHVLPALMAKMHRAKASHGATVPIWGSGMPRREFMFVGDLADAVVFLLKNYSEAQHVNVGTGVDLSIADLARLLADIIGFEGEFEFDATKPDGTPRKLLDVSRLSRLGWRAPTSLRDGVAATYAWYLRTPEADLRSLDLATGAG